MNKKETSNADCLQRLVRLWYVSLSPKKKKDDEQTQSELRMLLNGPGTNPMQQILWVAKAMCGIEDHREEKWARTYQKPMIFTDKSMAANEAQKHENEYWHATVREARLIEPNVES